MYDAYLELEFFDSDARPFISRTADLYNDTNGSSNTPSFSLGIVVADGLICPEGMAFYYRDRLVRPGTRVAIVWIRFLRVAIVPWYAFYYCVDFPLWHKGCDENGFMYYKPDEKWHTYDWQTRGSSQLRPFETPCWRHRRFWTALDHSRYSHCSDLFIECSD